MKYSPRSGMLVVSMTFLLLAVGILLMFAAASSLPYTGRPLQYFETPTPGSTPGVINCLSLRCHR
ncbi:hypothetical protein [Ktedonobacter robiniae]|uniref:hypothetical protein n=1 Tax=Ktedonobacter robiniae TaxID=2778365 RepID=UPI0019161E18|nr:hypothetical protein [Ktedonobacter robiniae]